MIQLSAGDWSAQILPEVGGSIGRLDWRGEPVLRPTPPGVNDPLATGCFPLVPFANRIDQGRFRWGDTDVELGATPGFEPHALHGQGWRQPWSVVEATTSAVKLSLIVACADWPWSWRADQAIRLTDEGLRVDLSLTNTDAQPMPGGLGLHPYFATAPNDRVRLSATSVWVGDTLIPDRRVPVADAVDWAEGLERGSSPFVDNAYEGWAGEAEIVREGRVVRLSSLEGRVHVYAPPGEPFICLEPVSHRPDALNAPPGEETGIVVLGPGETMRLAMRIAAYAAAQ